MGERKSKKRKRDVVVHQAESRADEEIDTSKPTAIFQSTGKGRSHTLSLAIPGSIIANAQSHDLRTALAGRIARAAAVFCVDEVIVFNDGQSCHRSNGLSSSHGHGYGQRHRPDAPEADAAYDGVKHPDRFLVHLLSYLECPPHLRRTLFPLHPNLRTAGSCPSLDMPHHLREDEWCQYREGVTSSSTANPGTTAVEVGFPFPVPVDAEIPPETRVTLRFAAAKEAPSQFPFAKGGRNLDTAAIEAEPVDPAEPREEAGYYWGYTVRQAPSLSAVFTESPHEDGYDISIGTSERGVALSSIVPGSSGASSHALPSSFRHALIVFGGVAGLEAAAAADQVLAERGITKSNVGTLFDFWVNACPGQGSKTIRTEEALWIALAQLHDWVRSVE